MWQLEPGAPKTGYTTSKWASVGMQETPLMGTMSCGQAEKATMQSISARNRTWSPGLRRPSMLASWSAIGMVALEAMACGIPVIASRVGGLPTIVKEGFTGYLIPWHCPEPFADGLDVLLGSQTIRKAMGEASRKAAMTMQWSVVVDSLVDSYHSLLAQTLAV